MKERLNLTIDGELLEAMKVYAAGKEMSVSELVENYFRNVTKPVHRKNILELVDELEAPGPGIEAPGPGIHPPVAAMHPPVAAMHPALAAGNSEPSGASEDDASEEDESDEALAKLEAQLLAWAKKPGPFTKVRKAKHGL